MNIFYDTERARASVNAMQARAAQEDNPVPIFTALMETPTSDFKVQRRPQCNLRSPRMTVQDTAGNVDEAGVRILGVLCQKTLPPVTRNIASDQTHAVRSLKQSVKITGLGDEVFSQFNDVVAKVQGVFETELGKDHVRGLLCKPYEGHAAFDISARYFTDRDDAPTQEHVPFPVEEDPKYILEVMRKNRFIHGEDNIVQYCRKQTNVEGKASYVKIPPDMFREGDIVEAHVGFACWPIGKDHFQLGLMLRALAIVDDGIREEAERKLRNIKVQNRRGTRKHREWETEGISIKRQRIVYDMED
ncbi:hypothetical protein BJ165DRAFT_1524612 [Panaeolus papilionaceus]|nr:hypothetical protein BJ165DRAFT_1524612 [Panaeolus papilionaceus]